MRTLSEKVPKRILPIIVTAQFFCTSLWFAGNGIMNELISTFNLPESALSMLTSSVQLGFIIGTLVFAFLSLADRFAPSTVFFVSAIIGAAFNLGIILQINNYQSLILFRFLTGFFLAGIYPVGMKIAADYYKEKLGKSLGYLVGALVVGTAFPHFAKALLDGINWQIVIVLTSLLALTGGLLIWLLVPDGPFRSKKQGIDVLAIVKIFKNKQFKKASFGYFGHMWELYTFWAFVPFILNWYFQEHQIDHLNISRWSFLIIGIGGIGCIISGYLSLKIGTKKVALISLFSSGICCLLSPLMLSQSSPILLICFLLFWGIFVIADSPLFSTLVANSAEPQIKATALTVVNCIGFSLTILSILTIEFLSGFVHIEYLLIFLIVGPLFGLISNR